MYNYLQLETTKLEFVQVITLSDLPTGERIFIELDGKPIVIFNIAGHFFAIGDVCTHDNGPLGDGDLDENEVICPRHGARFDVHSGKAVGLPAVVDIPAYPVRVVDGVIEVGIPQSD
jgi:3-phenylpropionate/trans-cinnamate dioxygenase ferredoxin component